MFRAVEGAEDDPDLGAAAIIEADVNENDTVVGISASGRAPFVLGALRQAKGRGAATVSLANNRPSEIAEIADIAIAALVGPEVLAGSTRLKSGTAQKMVLNMISTGAMMEIGKTYGNLMVDVQATNAKLRARALSIVRRVTRASRAGGRGSRWPSAAAPPKSPSCAWRRTAPPTTAAACWPRAAASYARRWDTRASENGKCAANKFAARWRTPVSAFADKRRCFLCTRGGHSAEGCRAANSSMSRRILSSAHMALVYEPLLAGLSALLILGGAAGILVGALSPWANVTLFHTIDLSLSGALFAGGGLCLAVALLVLLGMRRSALLCLVAAGCVLHWTAQARIEVPRRVKHQVIGAQLALSPLNRLLDQFHIANVDVADWGIPDPQLLAPGLPWTTDGALALLFGSLLGLPSDPVARWAYVRAARARCRACGARWPLGAPGPVLPRLRRLHHPPGRPPLPRLRHPSLSPRPALRPVRPGAASGIEKGRAFRRGPFLLSEPNTVPSAASGPSGCGVRSSSREAAPALRTASSGRGCGSAIPPPSASVRRGQVDPLLVAAARALVQVVIPVGAGAEAGRSRSSRLIGVPPSCCPPVAPSDFAQAGRVGITSPTLILHHKVPRFTH